MFSWEEEWPVTNAFCSCPLNPVAQGFTVTTLLLLKKTMLIAEIKMNEQLPTIPTQIRTRWCFLLEFLLTSWLGVETGEGFRFQRDLLGTDTAGGFSGIVEAGAGARIGEGEGVRKILEGDCDGEYTGDLDLDGEFDDGDDDNGEPDGAKNGENGDSDDDGDR